MTKTPYELWFRKSTNIDNLKVFGMECFLCILNVKRIKLDKKLVKGLLVGYIRTCKSFYVPPTHKRVFTLQLRVASNFLFTMTSKIGIEIEVLYLFATSF